MTAFARRHAGELPVLQVDIDTDMATAETFGVQSRPTVIASPDGHEQARPDGLIRDDDFDAAVSRAH